MKSFLLTLQIIGVGSMATMIPAGSPIYSPQATILLFAGIGAVIRCLLDPQSTRETIATLISGSVLGFLAGTYAFEQGVKGQLINTIALGVGVLGVVLAKELIKRSTRLSKWALDKATGQIGADDDKRS